MIHAEELGQFGPPLDVTAELTIATEVTVGDRVTPFSGTAALRFTAP